MPVTKADLNLVTHPSGTGLGQVALVQSASERQTVIAEDVGRAVGLLRTQILDEGGFAKEEADAPEIIEVGAQLVVGKDCEIGGDRIQIGAGFQLLPRKSATAPRWWLSRIPDGIGGEVGALAGTV